MNGEQRNPKSEARNPNQFYRSKRRGTEGNFCRGWERIARMGNRKIRNPKPEIRIGIAAWRLGGFALPAGAARLGTAHENQPTNSGRGNARKRPGLWRGNTGIWQSVKVLLGRFKSSKIEMKNKIIAGACHESWKKVFCNPWQNGILARHQSVSPTEPFAARIVVSLRQFASSILNPLPRKIWPSWPLKE